jgi:hypothetical protein
MEEPMAINIPKFWEKIEYRNGKNSIIVKGWSYNSKSEALEKAELKAKKILEIVLSGKKPDSYEYSLSPICEEIVEDVYCEDKVVAVISRNRYGALVLNTESVMFADKDFQPFFAGGIINQIKFLFNPERKRLLVSKQRDEEIEQVLNWGKQNPEHPFRLYKTFAGMRLIFVGKLYNPKDEATISLLNSLGSDPMYVKLTKNQACFRARLTPKPWRVKCQRPRHRFPYLNEKHTEENFLWVQNYTLKSTNHKVCELLSGKNINIEIPEIKRIVQQHDKMTLVDTEFPLA